MSYWAMVMNMGTVWDPVSSLAIRGPEVAPMAAKRWETSALPR